MPGRGGRRYPPYARIDKTLAEHDEAVAAILSAIRELMHPLAGKRRPIGFTANLNEKSQ